MRIVSISEQECKNLLSRTSIGRLACALDGQPYVVPVSFAYEPECLYVFSTVGQKVKWMRQNPKVCLQADEVGDHSNWISVVVNGTFLELKEPQYSAEKARARERLAQSGGWWETPIAERREQVNDLAVAPIFFRIEIASVTGLRSVPEGQ